MVNPPTRQTNWPFDPFDEAQDLQPFDEAQDLQPFDKAQGLQFASAVAAGCVGTSRTGRVKSLGDRQKVINIVRPEKN